MSDDNLLQRTLQFFETKLVEGKKGPYTRELVASAMLDDENVIARILGMAFRQQTLYRHTPGLGTTREGTKQYWHLKDTSVVLLKDPWPDVRPRSEALRANAESRAPKDVDESNSALLKSGYRPEAKSAPAEPLAVSVTDNALLFDLKNFGCSLNSEGVLTLTWDGGGHRFKREDSQKLFDYFKLFSNFPLVVDSI